MSSRSLRKWIIGSAIGLVCVSASPIWAQLPDTPFLPVALSTEARTFAPEAAPQPTTEDPGGASIDSALFPDLDSVSEPQQAPTETIRPFSPIHIAPLSAPNISTDNIGTGARPLDMVEGRLPPARPLPTGLDRTYPMARLEKYWDPSSICHKPLYFQDTMLERHGHERFHALQPMISGVKFFGTLPLMPYMMTLHRPSEDIYNLGHYRPGTAAPCLKERPPYDARAIGVQTLTTGAGFALLPF
jgi:hypothetical protein